MPGRPHQVAAALRSEVWVSATRPLGRLLATATATQVTATDTRPQPSCLLRSGRAIDPSLHLHLHSLMAAIQCLQPLDRPCLCLCVCPKVASWMPTQTRRSTTRPTVTCARAPMMSRVLGAAGNRRQHQRFGASDPRLRRRRIWIRGRRGGAQMRSSRRG
ncbi:hypothetical protein BCR44DRAFT_1435922 [Catenaria anguillulae PL171]|uniref:Uncharacterized protein n=1 Tax=Catenaria anguillulae PL171 TaxID=765915 RepID=A0A1Y2HIW8_9FUNG|nr:hypothetical protein BCR44DRAFT_1435922 [Catenaria anguillulae PL171]